MTDLLSEVEEDIREERLLNFWHTYGNYIIGLALVIILGTVGHTLWGYFKTQSQLHAYEAFEHARTLLKEDKKEEAFKAFQDLGKDGGGYGKLAQLYEAALMANPDEFYTTLAKNNVADPAFGNLAKILLAERSLDNAQVLTMIEPLTVKGNAWAPLAQELVSVAALKKGDDVQAAKGFIKILKNPAASLAEQQRAGRMLSQIDVSPALLEEDFRKEAQ